MNIEAMKIVRDNLKMGHVLSFAEMMIIQQAIDAAMLQAGNSPVIPDGWVMVPVEPTPEMREAFHIANEEAEDGLHGVWSPDHQWQAMLSAAPKREVSK